MKNPNRPKKPHIASVPVGWLWGVGRSWSVPLPHMCLACHLVAEAHRRQGKRRSQRPEDSAQGWAGFPLRLSRGQIKLKWFYFNSTHCIGEDCCAHRFEASRSHGIFKKKNKICKGPIKKGKKYCYTIILESRTLKL